MKNILLVATILILSGCSLGQTEIEKQQHIFLTNQLDEAIENLKNSVEGSGNRYEGVQFYEKSLKLKDKLDSIKLLLHENNIESVKRSIPSYIEYSQLNQDTISLDTKLILDPLKDLSNTNSKDYINSLLLYTTDAVQKYRDKFNSYFLKYDLVDIVINPSKNVNESTYEAEVFLRATRSTFYQKFEYMIIGDNSKFSPIPVNDYGIGELRIKDLPRGKTECIIKVTDLHNNDTVNFEQSVIIEK